MVCEMKDKRLTIVKDYVVCPKCGEIVWINDVVIRTKMLRSFSYYGGDAPILDKILDLIPEHGIYVEVFGGSATVLLNKKPSKIEVYNDLSLDLYNLFICMRDRWKEFMRLAFYTRVSRYAHSKFKEIRNQNIKIPDMKRAVEYFNYICTAFSRTPGAGFPSFRKSSSAHTTTPRIYKRYLLMIPLVAKRLENVIIENLDFEECIKRYDSPETLFYLDPPHILIERYDLGMSIRDHERLARVLRNVKGMWILKYTPHPLVYRWYKGYNWHIVKYVKASVKGKKLKGFYVLITNFD